MGSQSWVLEVHGEPTRVEEDWVQYDDGRLLWIKASYVAKRRVCDVPNRHIVVVGR